MMQRWKDSMSDRFRRARRIEWVGFALLSLMSLAVSAASFAATTWLV